VASAIAGALNGVSGHDRSAARRVLERLAQHLDPDDPGANRPARRQRKAR
jgi:hypothetical protein